MNRSFYTWRSIVAACCGVYLMGLLTFAVCRKDSAWMVATLAAAGYSLMLPLKHEEYREDQRGGEYE